MTSEEQFSKDRKGSEGKVSKAGEIIMLEDVLCIRKF